jgi:flagellar protein FliO/FliZ
MRALPVMFLSALSGVAYAAEPAVQAAIPASGAGVGAQLMQLLFGLLLVIGLIFFLAWLVRRMQQVVPRGGQVIQLLASQSLGTRERLLLVEVGGEQILLGLTPGNITALHVLAKPVSAVSAQPATPEFAQRLIELLGKNQKDRS